MNIIVNTSQLEELCLTIKDGDFISIDTEFIREKTYYPQLCLIQIATANKAVIIDPLSKDLDLSPLANILHNANIVKVFHSAKQDLEILYLHNKRLPSNIFDTQIASSFCDLGLSVGYESLVLELLNIQIDKSSRISDWSKRPLSNKQIEYALGDVIHLYKIYPLILKMLSDNKYLKWALEDMKSLNKTENIFTDAKESWKKIKDTKGIQVNLILKSLATWREIKAQKYNLPRNHFLKESTLIQLAQSMPITLKELNKIDNFGEFSEEIITLVQESLNKQAEQDLNEENINIVRADLKTLSSLKSLLKQQATKHNLPTNLIATTQDLKDLSTPNTKKESRLIKGWRYEVFGEPALKFIDYQKPK